jgi:membrane associated rhomboid family serine protease/Tfp pilus assembly protein PilF
LAAAEFGDVCEVCRQRAFAVHAEEQAAKGSQLYFLVTNLLLAINIVVFLVMLLKRVPLMSPPSPDIIRWGGNFGPLTMGSEPWRLLSNVFVHIGLLHLIANMWALFVLGRLAESLYGRASFLAMYLICGVAGSIASLLWNPMGVSAGASGAIFGILAALIATLQTGKIPLPKHVVRPVLWTLVFWAVFQFAYGFWKAGVDNAAHLGGFVAGLVFGFPLGHHLGSDSRARTARERIFTYALLALSIFSFGVWKINSYIVQVEHARILLTENKPDQAIALLHPALQKKPKEAYVHVLMAQALERKNDLPMSEKEYKQAAQLAPKNGTIWRGLAALYARSQRWEDSANAYSMAGEAGNDNGISWFNAGIAYLQLNRMRDAGQAFQKCVAVNPSFGQAWHQLGITQLNLKQNKEAVASLQQAAKLMPNNPDAHLWLGNALLSTGQNEPAKAEFLKALQLRAQQQRAVQELQRQQQRQKQQTAPASPK